ncbi:MAG TPA: hypothetical protein VKU00_28135 [Chthonomonadaceae bacterium]|nr:hypothetical protein [Chthonomonadaceae bacterium]
MAWSNFFKAEHDKADDSESETGLWETLQQEMERLRKEEIEAPQRALQAQAWLETQIKQQDLDKLKSLLRSKLDILVTPTKNPEEIDGLWFGVRRHYYEHFDGGYETRILWQLVLYRPCSRCGALRPALAFGDLTAMKMQKKLTLWQRLRNLRSQLVLRNAGTPEGVRKLARYLYDVERGRCRHPWADKCPNCSDPKK